MKDFRLQCVVDSLSTFGENTKVAILSQLDREGVSFTSEQFEIEKFCKVVTLFLGQWSDFIFLKITDEICARSKKSLEDLGIGARANYIEHSALLIEVYLKMESPQQIERRESP